MYIIELCDKPKPVNQIDCYYSPCISSSQQAAHIKKKAYRHWYPW